VTWWCVASKERWDWAFEAYPGVWLAVLALVAPYLWALHRRRRAGAVSASPRQVASYLAGALVLWVASDWPLGVLGAGYLASAHMGQYLLYSFLAAPLLMLGTPEWMARRVVGRLRLYRAARVVATPLVAGLLYNAVLLGTHSPWGVDTLRANQLGSFAMDVVWLLGALALWSPICSPLPEHRRSSYPVKMIYLFLAAGVIPLVPGGFMTFSSFPLYETYELAPRIGGFSAIDDQQLAGAVMKTVGLVAVWPVMAVMFWRWMVAEGDPEVTARRRPRRRPGPVVPR
jgi:putative membrane protein